MTVGLSVLDLVPVSAGRSAADALEDSLELVRRTEAAGYQRFWFAEHHLNPGVIGSSPAVLIALAAGVSTRIRLGSGAVQLGHRTPLSVAEEFGLLELAHPGRIDLGLGRSGRDPKRQAPTRTDEYRTAEGLLIPPPFVGLPGLLDAPRFRAQGALLGAAGAAPGDYDDQVGTLQDLFAGRHQVGELVVGVPTPGTWPQLWVLGSSGGTSAEVAGARGLPFAANYHVSPAAVLEAVGAYRAAFRPHAGRDRPHVMVSADVVVADDADTAHRLAQGYDHWVHSIRSGAGAIRYPDPGAAAVVLPPEATGLVADRTATRFVGSPHQVAEQLRVLRSATDAQELLITTITHDPAARVRSHDLLGRDLERTMSGRAAPTLQVGLVLDGPGADPEVRRRQARDWQRPELWGEMTAAAEWGGLDFVVLEDRVTAYHGSDVPRPDPIELAAHLTALTERIGLVVKTSVTHVEPFHLSNRLSSLDRAGGGRLGWWTGVDDSLSRARAYGRTDAPDAAAAEREAAEVLEAVRELWDSWEDDALIADARGGRFLDRDRIHYIDHAGEFFALRGPALLPRPIQGAPPVLVDAGRLGDAAVEGVVVAAPDVIGLVTAAAIQRVERSARVFAQVEFAPASAPGLTGWNREASLRVTSAGELTQVIRRLADQVDGVVLVPADSRLAVEVLADQVLPPLFEDGIAARPGPSTTLRQRWGLPRPENRYAADRTLVRS